MSFISSHAQKNHSNSAYVRVKVFKRPVIAKMLIDSGNLVNDLISEEFAKKIKVKYEPIHKRVGTAAKGGTVNIIGRSEAIKLFVENVPHPVIIRPYIVKELSHPINVGRDFLGRYQGKLEYSPSAGYLEILGAKAKLIVKKDALESLEVTDDRLKKVFCHPRAGDDEMVYEGIIGSCEKIESEYTCPVVSKENREIPGHSACFVKISTQGQLPLSVASRGTLLLEVNPVENIEVIMVPGLCKVIDNEAYCLMINPEMTRKKLPEGQIIGTLTVIEEQEEENIISTVTIGEGKVKPTPDPEIAKFIREGLQLDSNPVLDNDPETKAALIQLFTEYEDAISKGDFDYGHTTAITCQIQLKPGEEEPVKLRARPLNPAQEASMKTQLEEWEKSGIIEKTQSPWAFPMVGVKKKNSDMIRWCVDYRLLNKRTVKDAYPLSSIENNLHKLQGAKFFTTLDSAGAYHAVEIHPESREFTAFVTPFGQFQFARMPFGLSNAGACYSRLVALALQHLPEKFALAYLDDIVVFSKTVSEHIHQIRQVLEVHRKFGMKLKLSKCKILRREVEYLGHLVSEAGIQMIPSYVERILEWPLPNTGKQLKQFLGFIGYYRGFIPDVADLTYEMNEMKKAVKLTWTEKAVEKFELLKARFKAAPLRSYPNYESGEPFILDTDFSKTNLAAILSQKQGSSEKFIGAGARKCNKAEQNYPSHKGELAAAVMGMRKFEHILRFKPFILRTDSRCMQFLDSLKEVRGIYARWLNFVQGFEFSVVHRPGVKNQNADALSRIEDLPNSDKIGEEEEKLDLEEDVYACDEDMTIEDWTTSQPLVRQNQDPILKVVIQWVERGTKPTKEELRELGHEYRAYAGIFECLQLQPERGLVYLNPDTQKLRVCIPERLFGKAFVWAHCHPSAGHFGINATDKRMRERFFLPGMTVKITTAVMNCSNCILKRNYVNKNQHIFHRALETRPFEKIYVDIVGPLPESKWNEKSVNNIVTMMDGFTKWAEAIPVSEVTAVTVAKTIFEGWITRYGIPEQIHSDQGAQFTSEVYRELMRLLGIQVTNTPPYNPRSNKVERMHRSLGDILRSDQTGPPETWPQKLPLAMFAYRTAVSTVTGVTPFRAMFGINSRIPLDIIFPLPKEAREKWPEYVENLQKNLQQMYREMLQNTKQGIERATIYQTGKVSKPANVEVGNTVYYFSPRVTPTKGQKASRKLAILWTGPYEVFGKISDSLVKIRPLGSWAKNPREILTVVDKLRIMKLPLTENQLRPDTQVDLDEIEENLEDYGEYIQQYFPDPNETNLPIYFPVGIPECQDVILPSMGTSPGSEEGGFTGQGDRPPPFIDRPETPPSVTVQPSERGSAYSDTPTYRDAGPRVVIIPSIHSDTSSSDDVEVPEESVSEKSDGNSAVTQYSERSDGNSSATQRSEVTPTATITTTGSKASDRKRLRSDSSTVVGPSYRRRRTALLAEGLLKAGARMEGISERDKSTGKRKAEAPLLRPESEKKEKKTTEEEEEEEMEDGVNLLVTEEDRRGLDGSEGKEEYEMISEEEDEIIELYSRQNKKTMRMPTRVKEMKREVDHKGRETIPVLEGETRKIALMIENGVKKVEKIVSFRVPDASDVIEVLSYMKVEKERALDHHYVQIQNSMKKAPYGRIDQIRITEALYEIREISIQNGDKNFVGLQPVVIESFGWKTPEVTQQEVTKGKVKLKELEKEYEKLQKECQETKRELSAAASDLHEKDKEIKMSKWVREKLIVRNTDLNVECAQLKGKLAKLEPRKEEEGSKGKPRVVTWRTGMITSENEDDSEDQRFASLETRLKMLEENRKKEESNTEDDERKKEAPPVIVLELSIPVKFPLLEGNCKLICKGKMCLDNIAKWNQFRKGGPYRVFTSPTLREQGIMLTVNGHPTFSGEAVDYEVQLTRDGGPGATNTVGRGGFIKKLGEIKPVNGVTTGERIVIPITLQ